MGTCSEYIKTQFPSIDEDLKQYVEGKSKNAIISFNQNLNLKFKGFWRMGLMNLKIVRRYMKL